MQLFDETDWVPGSEPWTPSDGYWYDISNGYLKPSDYLQEDSLYAVQEAIQTLRWFYDHLERRGLVEEA